MHKIIKTSVKIDDAILHERNKKKNQGFSAGICSLVTSHFST